MNYDPNVFCVQRLAGPIVQEFDVIFHDVGLNVVITADGEVADHWLRGMLALCAQRHDMVVGISVGYTYSSTPAETIHLSMVRDVLIFQISIANYVPTFLREFLANRQICFAAYFEDEIRAKLQMIGLRISGRFFDMMGVGSGWGVGPTVLRDDFLRNERNFYSAAVRWCTAVRVNWGRRTLSLDQVLFASVSCHLLEHYGRAYRVWQRI